MMTRTVRISIIGAASVALLALTGCSASDSTEETCERIEVYLDDMQNLVPAEQEDNPEEMAAGLREMADQIQEIRDDASDEELASSLDAVIEAYETLHAAFDDADPEQSGDEIRNSALRELDFDALAEAGPALESHCDLG